MLIIPIRMVLVVSLIILGVPIMYSFLSAVFLMIVQLGYDPSFLLSYGFDAISAVVLLFVCSSLCLCWEYYGKK